MYPCMTLAFERVLYEPGGDEAWSRNRHHLIHSSPAIQLLSPCKSRDNCSNCTKRCRMIKYAITAALHRVGYGCTQLCISPVAKSHGTACQSVTKTHGRGGKKIDAINSKTSRRAGAKMYS